MARTFAWAGDALGIELFYTFTKDPAITLRQPRRGWAAETMTHVPKGAQWVSDEFILFLADRARLASTTTERVRAFFSYVLANGCVRFADEQHVVAVKITREEIIFTASRFKATTGDSIETFAIPLEGPGGHSFHVVAHELMAQMGNGFLLAHPTDATDVRSVALAPRKACS